MQRPAFWKTTVVAAALAGLAVAGAGVAAADDRDDLVRSPHAAVHTGDDAPHWVGVSWDDDWDDDHDDWDDDDWDDDDWDDDDWDDDDWDDD